MIDRQKAGEMMAELLWGFPGIGKSAASDGEHIIDVDCNLLQFQGVADTDLHRGIGNFLPDRAYPDNYIAHLKSLPSDVLALINCHISYLKDFPDTLFIYPDHSLKDEYLLRYKNRGDHDSFLSYMEQEFDSMVTALDNSPFRKIKITEKNRYLDDILKDGRVKTMFMTKQEMKALLLKAKELQASEPYEKTQCQILDQYGLKDLTDIDAFCMTLFEGKDTFDFDALKGDIKRAEAGIAKELNLLEKRGGLSGSALASLIMDGIVNGALGIRYAEIAPYSHGYEVTFQRDSPLGSTRDFTNRWECYCDFFEIGATIVGKIENDAQSNVVFGKKCEPLDIKDMISYIQEKEAQQLSSFIPEAETDFKRVKNPHTYPYRNDVASVMDVHNGKGLDGIVMHHYHGDYSTITPVKQNQLVEMLVCLKGFCLDAINTLDCSDTEKDNIILYLKQKGIDISTTEKFKEWMEANPKRCAWPHNRLRANSLDVLLQSAKDEMESKHVGTSKTRNPELKGKEEPDLDR